MPMRSSEARKPKPERSPEEEKAELGEQMSREIGAEAAKEGEPSSFADRFAADADEFVALQDRAVDKAIEMDKLRENPLGANKDAMAALQGEMDAIQHAIDNVADKYGTGTEDFVADAMKRGEINRGLADKKAKLGELMAMKEFMNYPGGRRGAEAEMKYLKDGIADLRAQEAEQLAGYDRMEAAGRAELAKMSEREIDNLVDFNLFEGDDYLNSPQFAAELDRLLPKADEPVLESRAATDAEHAEVMAAVDQETKDFLDSEEFGQQIEAATAKLVRMKAMEARIDAKLNRLAAAEAAAQQVEDARKDAPQIRARLATPEERAEIEAALAEEQREKDEMAKDTADAIKMALETSAEALKEKEELSKETKEAITMAIETSAEALREGEITEAIGKAETAEDLYAALDKIGEIKGSFDKAYSAADLKERIDTAMKFPIALQSITRKFGLRDKVKALIEAEGEDAEGMIVQDSGLTADEEEAFFRAGDEMSARNEREARDIAEGWEDASDLVIDAIPDRAPTKKEVKDVIEKNEVSPERRQALENEIAKLSNELYDLEQGAIHVDADTGKETRIVGMKEIEDKFREQYGLDVDAAMEKKVVSRWEAMKMGFKSLFSRDFRRTQDAYDRRLSEIQDVQDRLASAKLELQDPKAYADVMSKRLMKAMMLRARTSTPSRGGGGPLGRAPL